VAEDTGSGCEYRPSLSLIMLDSSGKLVGVVPTNPTRQS